MWFFVHSRGVVGYEEFQRTLVVASIPTKGEELIICESVADREIADFGFVNGKLSLLLVPAYFQLKAMSIQCTRRKGRHEHG